LKLLKTSILKWLLEAGTKSFFCHRLHRFTQILQALLKESVKICVICGKFLSI
jgi:hypothetical protein